MWQLVSEQLCDICSKELVAATKSEDFVCANGGMAAHRPTKAAAAARPGGKVNPFTSFQGTKCLVRTAIDPPIAVSEPPACGVVNPLTSFQGIV